MFDLPFQSPASPLQADVLPHVATQVADPSLPFSLTVACHAPTALMSAQARPKVLVRCATLAEAMQVAMGHADGLASHGAARMMAILDREDRLVLAGVVREGCVAWCHPVSNAAEARAVVFEASQTRAQAMRAAEWQDFDMAQRLRHRAECLDSRLVDPLWRVFAARPCRSLRDGQELEEGRGGGEPGRDERAPEVPILSLFHGDSNATV